MGVANNAFGSAPEKTFSHTMLVQQQSDESRYRCFEKHLD
jgi:hypothetical protein